MNTRKAITTSALALGVLAGSAGIASAMSSQGSSPQRASPTSTVEDDTQDPALNGSVQASEIEGQSEAEESATLESLASITADEAGQAALTANPGATVNSVELENENGSVVFEVDMTDSSGAALEVKVDAGNGAVLAQESGQDDDNEGSEGPEDEANEGPEADEVNEAPEVAPAD